MHAYIHAYMPCVNSTLNMEGITDLPHTGLYKVPLDTTRNDQLELHGIYE
jgi:hypothetical protein